MTRPHPQRIFSPSPPGTLLKRAGVADQPQRLRNEKAPEDAGYLGLIRSLPCLHCGMEPSEPAHLRLSSAAYGKASGLGKKPEAKWVLPLCSHDHRLAKTAQHNRSEQEFWDSLGINPLLAATKLWDARGDIVRMISVVHVIIASRSKK